MKHSLLPPALLFCLSLSLYASPKSYILVTPDARIPLNLGEEVWISGNGSKAFPIRLLPGGSSEWQGDGIRFTLPEGFSVERVDGEHARSLKIAKTPAHYVLFSRYHQKRPLEELGKVATMNIRSALIALGSDGAERLENDGKAVQRKISGRDIKGSVIELKVLNSRIRAEVFAFHFNGESCILVLQYTGEDFSSFASQAERILYTLAPQPGTLP